MKLYTVQENDIIACLNAGNAHTQSWERNAAFTGTPHDQDGIRHRAAYEYLTREFATRKGFPIAGAPIFCFLDKEQAAKTIDVGPPSQLLTLNVPDEQVLITNYDFWHWTVLYGWCGDHGFLACDDTCRLASWTMLFNVPEDILKQQAILSRIEPGWVVAESQ